MTFSNQNHVDLVVANGPNNPSQLPNILMSPGGQPVATSQAQNNSTSNVNSNPSVSPGPAPSDENMKRALAALGLQNQGK